MRAGQVLAQFTCGEFIKWKTVEEQQHWRFKQDKIDVKKHLDESDIVCALSVSKEAMAANQVVGSFRKLKHVEGVFRHL